MSLIPIGIVVSLIFALCYVFSTLRRKLAKQWDGIVINKKIVEKRRKRNDDFYTEIYYITIFKKENGKTTKLKEISGFHPYYDYLQINDKVRFHPQFNCFYEKYDKTKDNVVICPICMKFTDINEDKCSNCDTILIK